MPLFCSVVGDIIRGFPILLVGYAKAYSGVSLDSFIRKITFQEILPSGMSAIGPAIEVMAANEHLDAHKNAVTVRLEEIRK